MTVRSALRIAAFVLLALIGGIVLVAGTVYGGLQTETGRRVAVSVIERGLGAALDTEVGIDGLSEVSLDRLRVGGLFFGGREDPWLGVTGIDAAWRPGALLGGRLDITSLDIERLVLHRRPPSDESAESSTIEDLRLPMTISIGRLAVAALVLDAPIVGEPAALNVDGEATAHEDGSGILRLKVERLDGPGGRLSARAEYALASRHLDLGLSLSEPQGGLLAFLLDLPGRPAVSATLEGEGSLDGWRGRLTAAAGGMAADASVDVALGPRLMIAIDGTADVAAALPEALHDLVGPAVAFTVNADWDNGSERMHGIEARLASDAADALLRATVDGATLRTDGQLIVRLPDAGILAPLTAPADARSIEATVTIAGTLTRPAGHLDAHLEGLVLPGVTAKRATLSADYAFPEGVGGPATVGGSLRLAGPTPADERLKAMVGDEVRVDADGRVFADGDVEVTTARLWAAGGQATLSGSVAATGTADVAGSLEVPDLAFLRDLFGMPVGGGATATAALRLADGIVRGTVTAGLHGLALPEARAAVDLLGPDVSMTADIERNAAGAWRFDGIGLDGGALSAEGRAAIAADLAQLEGEYRVRLADLSALGAGVGGALAGSATLRGTVGGALDAPSLSGRLSADGLRVAGQPWQDFGIDYRIDDALAKPRGRLDARMRAPWDAVSLSADLAPAKDGRLAFRNITAETLGTVLSGDVVVDTARGLAEGRMTARVPDLGQWSEPAGVPLAGSLGATLGFAPDAGGRQDVTIEVEARQPRIAPVDGEAVAADGATARLVVGDVVGERRIDARIRLAKVTRGDLRLNSVVVGARGRPQRLDVSFSVAGDALTAKAAGTVAVVGGVVDVGLDTLSGSALGQRFALERPASLRHTADELAVRDLRLRVGDGAVQGDLRIGTNAVDLTGRLRALPLSLAGLVLPGRNMVGTIDGEIRLSGSASAPDGQLRMSTSEATVTIVGEPRTLSGQFDLVLANGTPTLGAKIEGPGGASLTFDGDLPVRVSAAPFAIVPESARQISATLRGEGGLAVLLGSLVPDPHRIAGRFDVTAKLSGSLSDPRADGSVRVTGGRYENLLSGTLVRDVALEARFKDNRLDILRAAGLAGSGRVEASGTLVLDPSRNFPLDIVLRADKAGVVNRDDISATTSGEITVVGPVDGPAINGKLSVDEAEVRLVDRMPPEVVALDVVEVNSPNRHDRAEPVAAPTAPVAPAGPGVTLDLTIAIPNRLFVRGQGLESEWSGGFHVGGSAAEPRLTGEVKPVRGQVSFAGKTFVLLQASSVAFRDPASTVPDLDITAEYRGDGFTARFIIRGRADDPTVTLSSVPELPQDEIVSRILFGRGVARISAVEAAQLAQTVASLSGRGGLGFLDRARRALGVDVLRVEAGEGDRGPALTAGRYLAKDVYVGVSQGAGAKSGEATVEVEVTPNVTIETEIGPTSGSQIGARWKFDY